MASRFFKASASLAAVQLDKLGLERVGRMLPKQGWTKNAVDEIELKIPVSDSKKGDIDMLVDVNNKFVVTENKLRKLHNHKLPENGNFEKAHFKSTFKDGVITVNIKNFKKNEVVVTFTE